jgi:hypothetical protein
VQGSCMPFPAASTKILGHVALWPGLRRALLGFQRVNYFRGSANLRFVLIPVCTSCLLFPQTAQGFLADVFAKD